MLNKINISIPRERAIQLLCYGIALIFWVMVKLSKEYETELNVQFQYELPDTLAFYDQPPASFKVLAKGEGWNLMSNYFGLGERPVSINVGAEPDMELDPYYLASQVNEEALREGVTATNVVVRKKRYYLETKVQKTVPVVLNSAIKFQEGYFQKMDPVIEPAEVTITGPSSRIKQIQFVYTDSLAVSDLHTSIDQSLELLPVNSVIQYDVSRVQVKIPVEPFTEKELFVPVQHQNDPGGVVLFPEQIRVTCQVGISRFDSLSQDDFLLVADMIEIDTTQDRQEVFIMLKEKPGYVRFVNFLPRVATVYKEKAIEQDSVLVEPSE